MEGKVRQRGFSSSTQQNYRLKRTFLMGRRRGSTSTTPVPTWKMITSPSQSQSQSQSLQNDRNPFIYRNGANAKNLSVSARKLASLVWEIDGPLLNLKKLGEAGISGKHRILESSKLRSIKIGLSHPPATTASQGILCSCRRRSLAASACPKPLRQVDEAQSHATVQTHGLNNTLKDVYNGLTTSKQLLHVLSRVRGLEQPECISSALVSALGVELDRSCSRVSKLIQGQKRDKSEANVLFKQITHSIHHAGELETEKKLRRRSEKLHKKTEAELAETRESLERAIKELESEKKARRKVEQVCEELARGVWELKRQFSKVREEVDKEREMFQIADLLREERLQMKLSDAKCLYEEKNALVDKLRDELEASLKGDVKIKDVDKLLRDSQENDGGANQVEEESSDDSDLHSIELSMEEISKSFKWGYAVKNGSKFDTSKGRITKKQPFAQNQNLQMTLLSECSTQ